MARTVRRSRLRMTGVMALVVSGFSLIIPVPGARAFDGAVCFFFVDEGRLEPGVTATTSKGTWRAAPTSFNCQGAVAGHVVTGGGIIAASGPYEGNCQSGTGSGVQRISIATAGGIVDLDIPITFSWTRSAGTGFGPGATGTGSGPGAAGTFEFTATSGDCFNTPVTGYTQLTQEILTVPTE
jgi:hypothetical protein